MGEWRPYLEAFDEYLRGPCWEARMRMREAAPVELPPEDRPDRRSRSAWSVELEGILEAAGL